MNHFIRAINIGLLLSIINFSGCSSITSLFSSTTRPDLSPYAENIIKITGDIHYGLSQTQAVYLREYIDGPKIEELHRYGDKTRKMLRNIIAYSIEVVTLGHAQIKDKEKQRNLLITSTSSCDRFLKNLNRNLTLPKLN